MKKAFLVVVWAVFLVTSVAMALEIKHPVETDSKAFIKRVSAKIEPVLKEYSLAQWKATTTGKKEWYKRYEDKEIEYRKILSDKLDFKELEGLKKDYPKMMSKYAEYDPEITRQLDTLYLGFKENQIDPKLSETLVKMDSALEKKFNTFRAKINGVATPDNKIREILKTSTDMAERKATWEASKQVGSAVAADLIALAKKRNEAATKLGYKNYYVMMLDLQEQNEKEIFGLLDDLAKKTDKPYKALKKEIDDITAKRFGIKSSEVMPWHYEDVFFQEAPQTYSVSLDKYFKGKDILKIVRNYYAGMGMPVDDILKRSDLFERKGKEQHAYCMHLDRRGDIRILANIKPDEYWTNTMLHELGHAVYEKYLGKDLPFVLRQPSHTFTTEGIAEMFGRLTMDSEWLEANVDKKKTAEFEAMKGKLWNGLRAHMLIFARWVEVMAHFERGLYSNPDQDLNKLWWSLVEKYQLVKKPVGRDNPDWAAKIHIATAPVYYHNYILGEIFASQLTDYIKRNIVTSGHDPFIGEKKVGDYLKEKVFNPGDKLRWDELVKFSTGEKLTSKYFANQFIK